jgi:hypothetical protein
MNPPEGEIDSPLYDALAAPDHPETIGAGSYPPEGEIGGLDAGLLADGGAETTLPFAEPGMPGIYLLSDAFWQEDAETPLWIIPNTEDMRDIRLIDEAYREELAEALGFIPNTEDSAIPLGSEPRWEPSPEILLRKLYDMIVSIETSPQRAPEVIIDLGPVREDKRSGTLVLVPSPSPVSRVLAENPAALSRILRESSYIPDRNNATILFLQQLYSGKYYLQIGFFDQKDDLIKKLSALNWAYPYALQLTGNRMSPAYKLLVGPVNEGESNALLLRFKRDGFNDAFIRRD